MKVSLQWIKEYTDVELAVEDLVSKIGAQLGAVEEVNDIGKKYQGIIIASVVSCEKHPNADKLKVCLIDDGGKAKHIERNDQGLVQVVCGAPNVKEGMTVAWLPPGTIVPSTFDKEPFRLQAREIRGVNSNGMLASPQELSISDDHNGLAVLERAVPGSDFAETYQLNDFIIDIENKMFTHRPDCFGLLGVAREVAGITGKQFKSDIDYREPKTTGPHPSDEKLLVVDNKIPQLVPRFMVQIVKNVSAAPSPLRMQIKLMKVGLKPINHIVDVTNYYMYLTGQPLHAYDYDKLVARSGGSSPKIIIRKPVSAESLSLLSGKVITLEDDQSIVIADTKGPIGLGGVMGGSEIEVDQNTKNIVVECATFDMFAIRKTSMKYGLFTDAVTRFSKGQSPLQNDRVLRMAVQDFISVSGAEAARSIYDLHVKLPALTKIEVTSDYINELLGIKLTATQMTKLLENVEFKVRNEAHKLFITTPFWRTDIAIPEDIAEEVGRLHGYDKLQKQLPAKSIKPTRPDETLAFKSSLRQKLASFGANEVLTYSFIHGGLVDRTEQKRDLAFTLSNALSPDLQFYRMSLTPSLLSKIQPNLKAGHNRFAIFEIGKSHNKLHKDDGAGVPREYDMLAYVYAERDKSAPPAYFQAKKCLEELAAYLGIGVEFRPFEKRLDYPVLGPFDLKRSALAYAKDTNIALGVIGEYKASVRHNLKLPQGVAGFEIGIKELQISKTEQSNYRPLSRYPAITQDLCLEVMKSVAYGELTKHLSKALTGSLPKGETVGIEPLDIYVSEEVKNKKRFTYRIKLTSYDRTLTEDVLTKYLNEAAKKLSASHGAVKI